MLSSHGRPGISQQVSGVALPYTERTLKCGHQMSETVNTTHRADQSTCLTYMYVYTPDYILHVLESHVGMTKRCVMSAANKLLQKVRLTRTDNRPLLPEWWCFACIQLNGTIADYTHFSERSV